METNLIKEVVVILALAVFVVLVFRRFKLPVILGFLLTGLIAGPTALNLASDMEGIHFLSETGVILLLFVIGLEFSPRELLAIKTTVLLGGSLQVGLSILLSLLASLAFGLSISQGVFLGFCISLSSTAIVLRVLQDQNNITSPHGRNALGILIFQDIVVVPMMLLTPLLAGVGGNIEEELLWLAGKMALVGIILFLLSKFFLPSLLDQVAKSKSRELFVLTTVLICFSIAGLTYTLGLSLALGAFLAGLLLSDSEYSHQATGDILPFREVFTSFFFVSIGMLLDLNFLFQHWYLVLPLAIAVSLLKWLAASLAAAALKYPLRTAMLTGFALFQVGEFAFVLAGIGQLHGLMDETLSQYFLSISILSMAATSFVMNYSSSWVDGILDRYIPKSFQDTVGKEGIEPSIKASLQDHIIIIGYGLNGTNLALAAKTSGIPYVIVDTNAESVKKNKALGEPIVYGDATDAHILEHLKVYQARVAVVAISDSQATRRIVASIRSICKTVFVVVRTRWVRDIDELLKLGADEVIPEEFETSIEIFTRVLNRYLVPEDEIESFTDSFRAQNYEMLRPMTSRKAQLNTTLNVPELRISCLRVTKDVPELTGKTLLESKVRQLFDINIMAIQRNHELISHMTADTLIERDDLLYLIGKPTSISRFDKHLKATH